jgi:hypothetical protein
MVVLEKPACIMWHDYRSWQYPALTCFRDELSKEREIFHIEDLRFAPWFNDPSRKIPERLMN